MQDDDHVPVDEAGPSSGAGPSDADAAGPSGSNAGGSSDTVHDPAADGAAEPVRFDGWQRANPPGHSFREQFLVPSTTTRHSAAAAV
jgi:hypothetical protein